MIIDAHVHYGNSYLGNFSPEFLISILDEEIDYAICSNLEGMDRLSLKNELDCNVDMLRVSKLYPKLKPLAVCQADRALDNKTIRFLLTEYKQFVGLKFHPECMKLPATSEKYDKYLELAREFKKPCLFHSGHIKSRFSSPFLIYQKAKQFPDVPFILGHLSTGPEYSHEIATDILIESIENDSATLYADVSWLDYNTEGFSESIKLIERLRNTSKGDYTSRILWGSDAPMGEHNQNLVIYHDNLNKYISALREYFKDEELINKIICLNTREVYKL